MKYYVKGKNYNVHLDTKHKHHLTWAKFVRDFEAAGESGVSEEDLLNICRADKNPGFLKYCVDHEWIRERRP
jgi:hypothetical protein